MPSTDICRAEHCGADDPLTEAAVAAAAAYDGTALRLAPTSTSGCCGASSSAAQFADSAAADGGVLPTQPLPDQRALSYPISPSHVAMLSMASHGFQIWTCIMMVSTAAFASRSFLSFLIKVDIVIGSLFPAEKTSSDCMAGICELYDTAVALQL